MSWSMNWPRVDVAGRRQRVVKPGTVRVGHCRGERDEFAVVRDGVLRGLVGQRREQPAEPALVGPCPRRVHQAALLIGVAAADHDGVSLIVIGRACQTSHSVRNAASIMRPGPHVTHHGRPSAPVTMKDVGRLFLRARAADRVDHNRGADRITHTDDGRTVQRDDALPALRAVASERSVGRRDRAPICCEPASRGNRGARIRLDNRRRRRQ